MSEKQETKPPQMDEADAQTSSLEAVATAVEGTAATSPGTGAAQQQQQPQQSSTRDEVLAMLEDAYGPSIWESAVSGAMGKGRGLYGPSI